MTQHVFSPDESRARNPEKWHDEQWRDILRLADFISNDEIVRLHEDNVTNAPPRWSLRSVFLNVVAGDKTRPPNMEIRLGDAFLGWVPERMFREFEQWSLSSEVRRENYNRMHTTADPRDVIRVLSVYIEDTHKNYFVCNCGESFPKMELLELHLSKNHHPLNGPARLRRPHDFHRVMEK